MMHVRSAVASAVVALVSLLSPAMVPQASAQFVFAEGTSQAEMDRYNQAWIAAHGPIDRYTTTTRWPGTLGEGARVAVSLVPDGVPIPAPAGVGGGDVASSLFNTLDGQFANLGGRTRWQAAIARLSGTATAVTPVIGGGVNVWQNVTNLSLPFQRRTLGANAADNPSTNFWDDGAPWGAPGPLHPPVGAVEAMTINFTANPPALVSAVVTINAARTQVTITRTPGPSPAPIDITQAANDTIGELVNTINLNAGFNASIGAGVTGTTPCTVFKGSQTANLSAGAPLAAFTTQNAVAPERGDIRIAMRPLPASIIASVSPPASDGGDIILNSTLQWTLGTNARVLQNTVARAVGEALGLAQVCPNDKTKLMEPILNLSVTAPQIDDIRGIQRLYGDVLNLSAAGFGASPTRQTVFEPNDDPLKSSSVPDGPWPLGGITLAGDSTFEVGLSLDDVSDKDFMVFSLGPTPPATPISMNVLVRITVTPVGGTYNVGPVDTACAGTPLNAGAVFNPRVNLFSNAPAGLPLGAGSPASATPFSSFIDTAGAGSPEVVTARLFTSGTFIIGISATGAASTQSLLYNLKIEVANLALADGVAFGPIASDFDFVLGLQVPDPDQRPARLDGFNGHGALTFRRTSAGEPHFYNSNYLGTRALYATLEGEIPSATPSAFAGRQIPLVQWQGVNPAAAIIADHPTQTTAAGTGATVAFGSSFFRGIAPEARLVTGSVASAIDPVFGFYTVSNEAVYYSLFTMADPVLAAAAGLPRAATVINSSWGGQGDTRGDSAVAWAYDATVSTYGTTIVCSAGNSGDVDNTDTCGPGGGTGGGETTLIPGGSFVGARTVGSPAAAFNVISVGAVGKGFYNEPFPPPQDDGTGGGGGGGGGGTRGSAGDSDPTGIALNTVVNFSSKGPVDTFNYTPNAPSFQPNTRPGVHIVAAGTGLIARAIDPALYQDSPDPCEQYGEGHVSTKGIGLPIPDPDSTTRFGETQGTSFSAPTVAGAVALLQDFGLAQVPPLNIDSLAMRAVLMTSAVKLPGWTNNGNPAKPQDDRDGRNWEFPFDIISTQISGNARPLDLAQGAGLLSIPYAFSVYGLGDLRDSPLTDPKIPTQTPAGEIPLPQFPGTGGRPAADDGRPATRAMPGIWSTQEKSDLQAMLTPEPPMPAAQVARIFEDIQTLNNQIVYKPHRPDTTDPDLTPGGGGKSAGTVDDRQPFLPGGRVPGSQTGDGPAPTKPIVLTSAINGGSIGWDVGNLGIKPLRLASGSRVGGVMDYVISVPYATFDPEFPAPPLPDKVGDRTIITATLVWNRTITVKKPNFQNLDNPQVGQLTELELENLDLELYLTSTGEVFDGQEPVAFSRSTLGNIEHIHFPVSSPGLYVLRVTWAGRDYNFFRNLPRGGVPYGLAWAWRPALDDRVSFPNTLPAPPTTPPAAGLPLLNEVLFRFGSEIGQASYTGLADVNQDGLVNTADLVWVLARLNVRPGVQYQDQ
jgi:hypothetical protein